ncbi:cytochrome-c peroxidase [Marinobacterium marinum]|uniref:Methylamine utilization protein MauG n=1 Tax=Marinobacterium marinum TaxID=2756129 RepID=A0A7W1WZF5_9GAMM|nr:cytochrome c peroxidase [Marinobacterium marinum]MBA4502941.1 cytochrome-c peroxidase [Marinobacterium marinum]
MRRSLYWFGVCVLSLSGSLVSQAADFSAADYRQPSQHWPAAHTHSEAGAVPELAPLPKLPPVDWHTPATEALGQQLFFDPRLSGSGQIACASCHDPDLGWADGRRTAFGHDRQSGPRNSMSILNVAWFEQLFWDGRAEGLLEQALQPISNPIEMNADLQEVLARLNRIPGYRQAFITAFGPGAIDAERLAKALAAFERRIVSRPNRLDRFIGGQYQLLNDHEIFGLHLYRTKAGCLNCHNGHRYSDGRFHHTGLSYYGRQYEDSGREQATGRTADRGKFRTPSLRDLHYTAPWMHNGFFPSLRGILNMYNAGMIGNSQLHPSLPPLSPLIRPLQLNHRELDALEAFLNTLSQRPLALRPPVLPTEPAVESIK